MQHAYRDGDGRPIRVVARVRAQIPHAIAVTTCKKTNNIDLHDDLH